MCSCTVLFKIFCRLCTELGLMEISKPTFVTTPHAVSVRTLCSLNVKHFFLFFTLMHNSNVLSSKILLFVVYSPCTCTFSCGCTGWRLTLHSETFSLYMLRQTTTSFTSLTILAGAVESPVCLFLSMWVCWTWKRLFIIADVFFVCVCLVRCDGVYTPTENFFFTTMSTCPFFITCSCSTPSMSNRLIVIQW